MDSIEPVRPRPPAITPIDATHVGLLAREREGSAGRRRRRERDARDGEAAPDAGEEPPSVVVDADLLDGTRAQNAVALTETLAAAGQEAGAHGSVELDGAGQEAGAQQRTREQEPLGEGAGGSEHIDLTV